VGLELTVCNIGRPSAGSAKNTGPHLLHQSRSTFAPPTSSTSCSPWYEPFLTGHQDARDETVSLRARASETGEARKRNINCNEDEASVSTKTVDSVRIAYPCGVSPGGATRVDRHRVQSTPMILMNIPLPRTPGTSC